MGPRVKHSSKSISSKENIFVASLKCFKVLLKSDYDILLLSPECITANCAIVATAFYYFSFAHFTLNPISSCRIELRAKNGQPRTVFVTQNKRVNVQSRH